MKICEKISAQSINNIDLLTQGNNCDSDMKRHARIEKQIKNKQISKKEMNKKITRYYTNRAQKQTMVQQKKQSLIRQSKGCTRHIKSEVQLQVGQCCQKTDYIEEEVDNFFSHQILQYMPNLWFSTPKATKSSKKVVDLAHSPQYPSSKQFSSKFNNQVQIKLMNLLQEKQKLLFKHSSLQNLEKYEQEAKLFLMNLYKHQQKENYNQTKLSKAVKLVLCSQQNYGKDLFYLRADQCYQNQFKGEILGSSGSFIQKQYISESAAFEKTWRDDISAKINEDEQTKNITKALLILTKCYKKNNLKANQILQSVIATQQQPHNKQKTPQSPTTLSHIDSYIKCLIKKNLINTFLTPQFQNDLQLYNYFKLTCHNQQNIINQGYRDNDTYIPIQTQEQYKQYMKRIKNKKIVYKPCLYTSCKACFSDRFEKYNPIMKCPQCKFRVHRFCGKIQDRCDRCYYKKLGVGLKAETQKCFICLNDSTSLMLHKIKGTMFAHNFCIMAHNLWTVQNQKFTFDWNKYQQTMSQQSIRSLDSLQSTESLAKLPVERKTKKSTSLVIKRQSQVNDSKIENIHNSMMLDENPEQNPNVDSKPNMNRNSNNICKFCDKGSQSRQQFLSECKQCKSKCHILCAYLNGCRTEISHWQNSFDMSLVISCCPEHSDDIQEFTQQTAKLSSSRRYRINYEKFAFQYSLGNDTPTTAKIIESKTRQFQEEKFQQVETLKVDKFDVELQLDQIVGQQKEEIDGSSL